MADDAEVKVKLSTDGQATKDALALAAALKKAAEAEADLQRKMAQRKLLPGQRPGAWSGPGGGPSGGPAPGGGPSGGGPPGFPGPTPYSSQFGAFSGPTAGPYGAFGGRPPGPPGPTSGQFGAFGSRGHLPPSPTNYGTYGAFAGATGQAYTLPAGSTNQFSAFMAAQQASTAAVTAAAVSAAVHQATRLQQAGDVFTATAGGGVLGGARELGVKAFGSKAAGVIGAGLSIGKAGMDSFIGSEKRDGNAYLTQAQREEAEARDTPLIGSLRGYYLDWKRAREGAYRGVGLENRRDDENEVRAHYRNQAADLRMSSDPDIRVARLREAEYRGLNGPRRDPNIDRSTALGRKLFEEEQRLLPARKELFYATKERAVAERNAAEAADDESQAMKQLGVARSWHATARGKRIVFEQQSDYDTPGGAKELQRLRVNEADARRDEAQAEKAYKERVKQAEAAKLTALQAKAGVAAADAGVASGTYENLRSREQTAASQAQRFGSASATDLAGAHNALMAFKRHGYDLLDPDSRSLLRQFYPDLAREQEEKSGARILRQFRPNLPNEYRDDLPEIRAAANAAGTREESAGFAAREAGTQGIAATLKEALGKLTDAIIKETSAAIGDIERKMNMMNSQIK